MAVTTTARRVLATGAIAGTALLALALPASAHTPNVNAKCNPDGSTTLTVNLTNYQHGKDGQTNTVKATDGSTVLVDQTFDTQYSKSFEVSASKGHDFTVTVRAWDSSKYNLDWAQHVDACVTPPTTTTTVPPTTTTTTVAPTSTTSSEAPVPPVTSTPPAQQGGGLPDTGANVGLPLGIGALLLVGGGALLLVVRKRRAA